MPEKPVEKFVTKAGRKVFRIPVETFPKLVNHVYLILDDGKVRLLDCGLGSEPCMKGIIEGMTEVGSRFGENVSPDMIREIIITHGHIDHFGGLIWLKKNTRASILIHELDSRILTNFAERLIIASKDLGIFLKRAGVGERNIARFQEAYTEGKDFFSPIPVDRVLKDRDALGEGMTVIHTPGHCPGHVCLLVDDILFAGDHILSRISPHQSPESITHFCGLHHYLESLEKLTSLSGVSLTLPAHQDPIRDLAGRIGEIRTIHKDRLSKILEVCREPRNISEISVTLFGETSGYNILLALEETGAHVEYLYEHGKLGIANLDGITREDNPVIFYRSL